MTRIAIPAVIVMMAVAGLLATAGWNASGEPLLVITLTERELPLAWTPRSEGDDPGLQLRLAYDGRADPLDARNWLSEQRLREIGFALHVPAGTPPAAYTYDHVPARVAWIVFEYDGPVWREVERRRTLRDADRGHAPFELLSSRLVPVDASVDVEALRRRYPSGHLILRGLVGLSYSSIENGGWVLHGLLWETVPQRVAVPRRFRSVIEGLASTPRPQSPRYEVELAVGRLGLPYVRAIRALGGS